MIRLGILGSTRGTNMLAIADAIQAQQLAATIAVVVSNKPDAIILQRAISLGLPAQFVDPANLSRETYDTQVSSVLRHYQVDLIILTGYMRILSAEFTTAWQNRIMNVHPSLLPAFAGKMDLAVHQDVLSAGVNETGCTVHFVTEKVDAGPIILQKKCPVLADDTPELLKTRVQSLEGTALVAAIDKMTLIKTVAAP